MALGRAASHHLPPAAAPSQRPTHPWPQTCQGCQCCSSSSSAGGHTAGSGTRVCVSLDPASLSGCWQQCRGAHWLSVQSLNTYDRTQNAYHSPGCHTPCMPTATSHRSHKHHTPVNDHLHIQQQPLALGSSPAHDRRQQLATTTTHIKNNLGGWPVIGVLGFIEVRRKRWEVWRCGSQSGASGRFSNEQCICGRPPTHGCRHNLTMVLRRRHTCREAASHQPVHHPPPSPPRLKESFSTPFLPSLDRTLRLVAPPDRLCLVKKLMLLQNSSPNAACSGSSPNCNNRMVAAIAAAGGTGSDVAARGHDGTEHHLGMCGTK